VIYLDHAATAYPKPKVVCEAIAMAMNSGNPGRSAHGPSMDANRWIYESRCRVASLLEAPQEERIIFNSGATEALNTAILGMVAVGDRVISTDLEHNAVARTLQQLQKSHGIKWQTLSALEGQFHLQLESEFRLGVKPALVIVNHVSNVTGVRQSIDRIRALCDEYQVKLIIDASQSMGHEKMRLRPNEIICFSAHKGLMGPMGVGVLAIGHEMNLKPFKIGGTGTHSTSLSMPDGLPEALEAGTPNVAGIYALGVAVQELLKRPFSTIVAELQKLRSQLYRGCVKMDRVSIHGPEVGGSALSITIKDCDLGDFAQKLWSNHMICCRIGLHCSPLAHKSMGTFPNGTLRVSMGISSQQEEIQLFLNKLESEIGLLT